MAKSGETMRDVLYPGVGSYTPPTPGLKGQGREQFLKDGQRASHGESHRRELLPAAEGQGQQ